MENPPRYSLAERDRRWSIAQAIMAEEDVELHAGPSSGAAGEHGHRRARRASRAHAADAPPVPQAGEPHRVRLATAFPAACAAPATRENSFWERPDESFRLDKWL